MVNRIYWIVYTIYNIYHMFYNIYKVLNTTVQMKSMTINWHMLFTDWSVRPIIITSFRAQIFGKFWCKSNVCIILYDLSIALYLYHQFPPQVFHHKKQLCLGRTQLSSVSSADITATNHCERTYIFGDFTLATLTSGLCTSPTDNFPFTYIFPSVPISIHKPLNCGTICAEDNFQRFQCSINIFNNPDWWMYPFPLLVPSIYWIKLIKRCSSRPVSTHQFAIAIQPHSF